MRSKMISFKKDKEKGIIQGNKLIEAFMGGYNLKMFYSDSFLSTRHYNESWDTLMEVIGKIKESVFNEGYDMFMPEHTTYAAIGNACYDADLPAAWQAVVRWITLRFDLQVVNFEPKEKDAIVYRAVNEDIFKISPHVVMRYRERFSVSLSIDEICQSFQDPGLIAAYKEHGDGKYHVGEDVVVVIDNFKIITVFRRSSNKEKGVNVKIAELTTQEPILKKLNIA